MHAAAGAGVALDRRLLVDDLQLVGVRGHAQVVPADDTDQREGRALRLPALGAAADVVEGDVALDLHADSILRALARQRAAREIARALLHAVVDGWMDVHFGHVGPLQDFRMSRHYGSTCPRA